MALWIADSERGLVYISRQQLLLCPQPLCLTACGDSVICAAQDGAHVYAPDSLERCGYPLPPGVCRMCALPGALYCLSGEADSVSMLCPVTGRLRLCAQCGCYPRDMQISPCGKYLLIAGGAAGETLLLSSQDLKLIRRFPVPGMACAAVFAGREVYTLCAVEDGDVSARLLRISPRGVQTEVYTARGLPGALGCLPDQSLLCGILGECVRLRTDGRVLQRYPGGLTASIRAGKYAALLCDPLDGSVQRVPYTIGKSAETVYPGASPSDVLLM